MTIQQSSGERTAAMRSTSNRLLRIKQASASSILRAVSRACGHGSEKDRQIKKEREREKERESGRWWGEKTQEGGCCHVIVGEDKRYISRTIEQHRNQCVFQAYAIYGWDGRRRGDREIKTNRLSLLFFPCAKASLRCCISSSLGVNSKQYIIAAVTSRL